MQNVDEFILVQVKHGTTADVVEEAIDEILRNQIQLRLKAVLLSTRKQFLDCCGLRTVLYWVEMCEADGLPSESI
jgi:hypothetical protein